jgi:hypothetical protein
MRTVQESLEVEEEEGQEDEGESPADVCMRADFDMGLALTCFIGDQG